MASSAREGCTLDGEFVFAVSSTGIYCRPSCPSRRPRRDRVSFFSSPETAEQAGFRACLRCHPRDPRSTDPRVQMARDVCRIIEENDGEAVTLNALSEQLGVSSFHLQRTFKSVMGITPKDFAATWRAKQIQARRAKGRSRSRRRCTMQASDRAAVCTRALPLNLE